MRKTTEEFIEDAHRIHNFTYDYSKSNYTGNKNKIIITCKKHGDFLQTPNSHLRYIGCPQCGIESRSDKLRKNTKDFIKEANRVHNNTYNYSKSNYTGNKDKITITCKKHGDFLQTPSNHLQNNGCPHCGREKSNNKRRKLLEDFIEEANIVHNNTYDYSKSNYTGNKDIIIIICKKHGDFLQTPSNHLLNQGCPQCGIENRSDKLRKSLEDFIEEANIVHNNTYDYSKSNYTGAKDKIIIICKKHGDFLQEPSNHLQYMGCPQCGIDSRSNKLRKSLEDFIEKANIVHNNTYDYSKSNYTGANEKIIITCKKHGDFLQTPSNHLQNKRCPSCAKQGYSKMSNQWLTIISLYKNIDIQYVENEGEFILKNKEWGLKYKFDGYIGLNNKKICLEFNGCVWHGCKKCYKKEDINKINGISFGDLYERTIIREMIITDILEYRLIKIYECEWLELIEDGFDPESNLNLKEYLDSLDI